MDFVGIARRLIAGRVGGWKVPVNGQNPRVGVSQAGKPTVFEHLSALGSAPDVNVGAILTKPFGLATAGGKSVWIL